MSELCSKGDTWTDDSVLAPGPTLPGFWIFMYRVSPFTYFVEGLVTTAVGRTPIECAEEEYLRIQPPSGQTCGQYLDPYAQATGGYLTNPDATSNCSYCSISSTDQFLEQFDYSFTHRWRDFGLIWVYIVVHVVAAIFLYWLVRVVSTICIIVLIELT